jgi:hypothetical protein
MQADEHIGEAAELYAAGQLDAVERVNKPLAPPVATNVVAFARRRISPWWLVPAMAAALIVGILWPRAQSQHDVATLAMVNGHFSHAQFAGTGPKAKVLYARDRSWYYVIVAGTGRYDVYGVAGDNRVSLGSTNAVGSTNELFVKMRERFDHLELQDGAATETATIR